MFNDDPAIVTMALQHGHHLAEIHSSGTKLAEELRADGSKVAEASRTCVARHAQIAILEVHMPHARDVLVEHSNGVAAAVHDVPGVEHQTKQRWIGEAHQFVDLGGRFDVSATVRVEDRAQPCLLAHSARHSFGPGGECRPGVVGQAVASADPSGILLALRDRRVVVGQDDERVVRAGVPHQFRRPYGRRHTGVMCAGVCQRNRDERADQLQAALGHLVAKSERVGRHETPVAELRPRVPCFSNLVEHGGVRRSHDLTCEFQNAPRTWRVGDANHGRMIICAALASRVLFRSSPLSPGRTGTAVEVTPARAGWRYVHFAVRQIAPGKHWVSETGAEECILVLLAGCCRVAYGPRAIKGRPTIKERSAPGTALLGPRRSVFAGYPHAIYLPPHTSVRVEADVPTELADGRAPSRQRFDARVIPPDACGFEIRGGGNATRQIVDIVPPGFPADRLLVCEVFTPAGNWSSYPPHKHDTNRPPGEVKLEEIYYYRFEHREAFGLQRLYDGHSDRTFAVHHGDVMLIRSGYHPFVTSYGYNAYYLNVLAGTRRSMAASDDPRYAAFRAWPPPDARVPVVAPPSRLRKQSAT